MKYFPKPIFVERINSLLRNEADRENFWRVVRTESLISIRCNTLKISPAELRKKLEHRGWRIEQPYEKNPEIMIIKNKLLPGELGKAPEHLLGYYYIQELSSMMPILALQLSQKNALLDIAASPGSKTTQASALMENRGVIIANDISIGRISILAANLEKIGCTNVIVTRHDGVVLCEKLKKLNFKFDKILADVPCSGEGNIRNNPKTFKIWSLKAVQKLSKMQKKLASSALKLLKPGGEMLYSTCTHSPEENECVVQHLLDNFRVAVQDIKLPIKTRSGLTEWQNYTFSSELKKARRIYPQDNNTEGFFLCKIRKEE